MLPPSCCFGSPTASEVEILYNISATIPRKLLNLKAKEKVIFSCWNYKGILDPNVQTVKEGFSHRVVFGGDKTGRPKELTSKEIWKERLGIFGKGVQTVNFHVEVQSPTVVALYVLTL